MNSESKLFVGFWYFP